MKCPQCGTKNEAPGKFCKECGADLQNPSKAPMVTAISELYGKEVEVLFFIESFSGKVTGIVNPTEDQLGRYREAILQRVIIEAPSNTEPDENIGAILTFIRQSKEYLGEKYTEAQYRNFSPADLKKEYLKLFERILKEKSRKGDTTPLPTNMEKK